MHRLLVVLIFMLLFTAGIAFGRKALPAEEEIRHSAEQGLGEILDLWRDGRYELLYERTLPGGGVSREAFIERLSAASRRPACCWEKLQEVKVTVKSDESVIVRGRIGLESAAGSTSSTRDLKLTREGGVWLISRGEILSLAGEGKARTKRERKK